MPSSVGDVFPGVFATGVQVSAIKTKPLDEGPLYFPED
jgi:hypothetical protein